LADPDVWMRTATAEDGSENYEYILVYVDDLLVLSHQGDKIMKTLEELYRLKDGFDVPTQYLGAKVKQWVFPQDASKPKWALSSAIKNIEQHLKQFDRRLYTARQPMHSDYSPELDITPVLDDDTTNFYQSQISILRWIVELGQLDIYLPVAFIVLISRSAPSRAS